MIVGSCRTSVFVYDVNGSVHRENIVLYNLYGSEIYELLASCWGPDVVAFGSEVLLSPRHQGLLDATSSSGFEPFVVIRLSLNPTP